jgi:hypothetical protein
VFCLYHCYTTINRGCSEQTKNIMLLCLKSFNELSCLNEREGIIGHPFRFIIFSHLPQPISRCLPCSLTAPNLTDAPFSFCKLPLTPLSSISFIAKYLAQDSYPQNFLDRDRWACSVHPKHPGLFCILGQNSFTWKCNHLSDFASATTRNHSLFIFSDPTDYLAHNLCSWMSLVNIAFEPWV